MPPAECRGFLNPGLAGRGQTPQVGAPDQHRTRAQRQRLTTSLAAPDAAVQHYLDLVADRRGNCGQGANPMWGAVQVVAAMIRHRDRRNPAIHGLLASSTRITP